jgi:hypothetical protein
MLRETLIQRLAYPSAAKQTAEKVALGEKNRDSSGLKPLGMTKASTFVIRLLPRLKRNVIAAGSPA